MIWELDFVELLKDFEIKKFGSISKKNCHKYMARFVWRAIVGMPITIYLNVEFFLIKNHHMAQFQNLLIDSLSSF